MTNGSTLIRSKFCDSILRNNSYPSSMARPGTKTIHYVLTCAQLRFSLIVQSRTERTDLKDSQIRQESLVERPD